MRSFSILRGAWSSPVKILLLYTRETFGGNEMRFLIILECYAVATKKVGNLGEDSK